MWSSLLVVALAVACGMVACGMLTCENLCATRCLSPARRRRQKATHFAVTFGAPIPKGGSTMLSISITTEQKELVSFVPTSDAGNEVKSDEPVQFTVTSGTVTVDPQPDGVSAFIVSGSAAESAVVTVTDASGNLTDTVQVTVTEPVATHFVETAQPPVAK